MSVSSEAAERRYKVSRFNTYISSRDAPELIFNSVLTSLLRVPVAIRDAVAARVCSTSLDMYPVQDPLADMLVKGGFLVPREQDELQSIKDRFHQEAGIKALSVTIIPTLNCNLACTYCYQHRHKDVMQPHVCDAILQDLQRRLACGGMERLEVDWYGGEPLMAPSVIRSMSHSIMKLANDYSIPYEATMTTNGTLINAKTIELLKESKISQLQITLDGPKSQHDLRRPYRDNRSSFQAVVDGIRRSAQIVPVIVRINVDRSNLPHPDELLDILDQQGFFTPELRIRPYVALVGPINNHCAHTLAFTVDAAPFFAYVLEFQRCLTQRRDDWTMEEILEYPRPLSRACGAQSSHSLCIHPVGQVFKCGLEIDEPELGGGMIWEDYWNHPNYRKWVEYDPFAREQCSDCNCLPVCLGGCQKYNFQEGHFYKGEACTYWHKFLPRILTQLADFQQHSTKCN